MDLKIPAGIAIPPDLLEEIRAFPTEREVDHCGERFCVSSLDFYAQCPACGARIKMRGFSGHLEVADLFDAVFAWMALPGAREVAERRCQQILEENEE